ncbi:major tail protein [Klebsiella phage Sushi]|uniref:Major tail protein n=2 Tax=Webervirus sushi TaxID=1981043 RepID=A0A0H4TKL8_9CAUD|nr:major tail protein [Klebsiella phage Sushi]AKQ07484.1 major tail protein [Klebsiella phage Sushi]QBZ71168.1 major tail protein [Klebsiella phage Sanco]
MHLPNGAKVFFEKARGAEIPFTAMTNDAKNPKITVADGKLKVKDIVIFTDCTWGDFVNKVARVKAVTASVATLEEFDTSDKNKYPGGAATGSVSVIADWVELPCIQDLGKDGNEQQFYNYQCLSDEREQSEPTYKSAVTLNYTFAHEYDNAIYPILRSADASKQAKAMYMYIPRASEVRYWSGIASFDDIPSTAVNEMETVTLNIALKGAHVFLPVVA